jgi:hypothetical protein
MTNLAALTFGSHNIVVYFNGGCPICVRYIETLEHDLNSAGFANVVKYDYYADSKALRTLSNLRENLGVPEEFYSSVTTVVDGRYVFVGYFPSDAIVGFVGSNPSFEKLIAAQGLKPDTYQLLRDDVRLECSSPQKITDCLSSGIFVGVLGTWSLVLVSGLVNGLNPCALLVFVYFVGVVSVHSASDNPADSLLQYHQCSISQGNCGKTQASFTRDLSTTSTRPGNSSLDSLMGI